MSAITPPEKGRYGALVGALVVLAAARLVRAVLRTTGSMGH